LAAADALTTMRGTHGGRFHLRETMCARHSARNKAIGNIIMVLLSAFIATVVVGDLIAVGIAELVEYFSKTVSLFVFLGLFILVIPLAWRIALRITEPKSA
jgi:hypothetical protein